MIRIPHRTVWYVLNAQVNGTSVVSAIYSRYFHDAEPDMRPSTLQRAFELAASGRFVSVTEIRSRLAAEGYFTAEVCGPLLCKQLMRIISKRV